MTARSRDRPVEGSSDDTHALEGSERNVGRWGRVASAALGGVLAVRGLRRRSLAGVATAVAGGLLAYRGITGRSRLYRALDVNTATGADEYDRPAGGTVERSITVGRPAEELAEFWREPDRLTRIVGPFADVSAAGADGHRWTLEAPLGRTMSWETVIVEDRPGERLRWTSLDGAPIPNEGEVRFRPAPGDRGTVVTLGLRFDPPGGPVGDAAAEYLGIVPDALAGEMLNRFKSLAETGEAPSTAENPSARGSGDLV